MRIVLVGAGNVATSLGLALRKTGHEVVQVVCAHLVHAEELARRIQAAQWSDSLDSLAQADAYILSVTDSALPLVAEKVCGLLKSQNPQALIVHTAGSLPLDVLNGLHCAVLYPMQTFSKAAPSDFAHLPLFLEATDAESENTVMQLACSLSDQVFKLSSQERRYLHLAAVFCCNFANHCMAMGEAVLKAHGVPFSVMYPLIDGMTQKLHRLSPRQAQTGPAVRGDNNVMESQLELLKASDDSDMAAIYQLLSIHIQKYRERK